MAWNAIFYFYTLCYALGAIAIGAIALGASLDTVITDERTSSSSNGFLRAWDIDILRHDITEKDLYLYAKMEVDQASSTLPVEGMVIGMNRRFMLNILTRRMFRRKKYHSASPYTFLSKKAMSVMVGDDDNNGGNNMPLMLKVEIHGNQSLICYLSLPDKDFANVILPTFGAYFFARNGF